MAKTLATQLSNISAEAAKQFSMLREELLNLHPSVEEKLNKYTVVYRLTAGNIYAECYLQKNRIRIQIRNRNYIDPEGWVKVVPETHLWTLDHYIFVEVESPLDYTISILRQSLNDVLPQER